MPRPVLLAAALAALAPAAASAAMPVPGALYEGTTDTGSPFSFRVAPDGSAVTHLLSSAALSCVGPEGGVEVFALATKVPIPVSGGAISGSDEDVTPRIELAGTFTSATEASGTLIARTSKFSYGQGLTTCMKELSWTARTAGASAAPGAPSGGSEIAAPSLAITAPRAPKLAAVLTRGLALGGEVGAPATVTAVAKLAAKDAKRYRVPATFAKASANAGAAGPFSLRLTPAKATARKLKGAKKLVLSVRLTAQPAGAGEATTQTRRVTLKR